jgi:hypothetical protein
MEFCRVRTVAFVALMLALFSAGASAQVSVTVAWNANTEPDVTGYTVSWGMRPGVYTASADAGKNTQYTVTGLAVDQRYYFVVQAYNADGLRSLPSNVVSNDALITYGTGTLFDQRPSIFWHNQSTGQLMSWQMNGATVVDTRAFSISGNPDTAWKVAGTGDLNGDRHPDIVWRHSTEGWLAVWFLQNNLVTGTSYLSINRMPDTAWRIGGVGDMNADGFADLVWQNNTDGRLAIWYMRNEGVIATQLLALNVGPNSRWQIATIGDLNRDGAADIIWQTTDAWLAVWLQQSGNILLTQYLSIPQMPDSGWRMVAAGYPGGGTTPAIIWRHSTRGDVAFWYMQGSTVLSTVKTTPSVVQNSNWKIVGTR